MLRRKLVSATTALWVAYANIFYASVFSISFCNKRLAQNWHGQGESDCIIKTKH